MPTCTGVDVVSRIGVTVHRFRDDALMSAKSVADWAISAGHEVCALADDAGALGVAVRQVESFSDVDVLVALGGDGTMLRAVQLVDGEPVPIIGVNVGLLGYLTSVEQDNALVAVQTWCGGTRNVDYSYEDRMLLEIVVSDDTGTGGSPSVRHHLALNEVVLEKVGPGHTVRLGVAVDNAPFTTYAADGLIIATPTGSTAYAMSVRGPILSPRLRAVLLAPVSPHMLFDRSLVLDASEPISVEVLGYRGVNVAVDGAPVGELSENGKVEVRAASQIARFVTFEERHFHQILKSKFGLSDR
jgi:NAD+ kinase